MKIIVDVNALISALLRESTSRSLIVNSGQDFCFPEPSLHKIRKYKDYILGKSGFSELEFLIIFHTILYFMRVIPTEAISQYWDEAQKIMEHIDPEDVTIIAAALSQENSVIWSNDAHFDQQNKVFVLKTEDMVKLFPENKEW